MAAASRPAPPGSSRVLGHARIVRAYGEAGRSRSELVGLFLPREPFGLQDDRQVLAFVHADVMCECETPFVTELLSSKKSLRRDSLAT